MKKNIFKKSVLAGILALTLITTAVPAPRAEAATLADLQAQIQILLNKLQAMQGQVGTAPNTCVVFTTDLTVGHRGSDVTSLQKFLISQGFNIPDGATGYFGAQTRSALAQFQSKNGVAPAVGYFGPLTRAKVAAICAVTVTPPTDNGGSTPTPSTPPLSGEASLERFDARSADNTNIEEGVKNADVMDIMFDVKSGDARLNRVEIAVTPALVNDEKRPWRVFDEIAIYDGTKRLAKIDASNRSNWRENSPTNDSYMIRLSGMNTIMKSGDTTKLTVKVSTARNIRGIENSEVWNIFVPDNGIRAIDADNVGIHTGDTADYVSLNIDAAGSTDEIIVKRSNADVDSTTLQLKSNTTSGYTKIFAFDLDTNDSAHDIEISRLPIQLTVSSSTVGTFMRDVRLVIDGKNYTRSTVTDGTTNTIVFDFRRGEFTIDNGDKVTVTVEVNFKSLPAEYEGTAISGSVLTASIDAEGVDYLTGRQLSGSAISETHVLNSRGIAGGTKNATAEVTSVNGAKNDYATFSISADVTAFGQDVYIPTAANSAVNYQLENQYNIALVDTGTPVVTSDARESGGYYHISDGETKTVTLDVTYLPGVNLTVARLQLLGINYNSQAAAPNATWDAVPASRFETPTVTIVD